MKKLIISGSVVVVVAVLVTGATIAFFNDIETSTGNIFTAGTIDLTIDSNGSSYNGASLPDKNFPAKDLIDEKFFVFDDIKPGDYGVRDISIHVSSNPAYVCLIIHNKNDDDNGITDPEDEVDNVDDNLDGTPFGDLSGDLELFAWEDMNADQTYDPVTGEVPLTHDDGGVDPDSFFDITYEIMFDSTAGIGPFVQNGNRNFALAWCAGTQTVDHVTGEITCDGSGMGDISQSDIFTADISLYAEQVRNNPDFTCADVDLEEVN